MGVGGSTCNENLNVRNGGNSGSGGGQSSLDLNCRKALNLRRLAQSDDDAQHGSWDSHAEYTALRLSRRRWNLL